jgi:hypothetical protein
LELNESATPIEQRDELFRLLAEEFVKTSGGKTVKILFDSLNPVAWLKALKTKPPNIENLDE